jgi:hypothetical protein
MARRSSPPIINDRERLFDLTNVAVDEWFVDSGTVRTSGEIERNRTLESYGLETPHLNELSTHIIRVVKKNTGVEFTLTANQLSKFSKGTVDDYIKRVVEAALPGEPVTLPKKPVTSPASALPGEPRTLPGKPSPKRPKP